MLKFFAAALALLPAPALADVTARYVTDQGKPALLVEVDDGGNARIGADGVFGVIRRDGTDYLFMVAATGETRVTELAALVTMVATVMTSAGKGKMPGAESMRFELIAKGETSIAGRTGSAWSFGPAAKPGKDAANGRRLEVVMSSDPVLAPVGTMFRRLVEAGLPILAVALPEESGFAAGAAQLIAKGTPLRIADKLELQSTDTAEIDPRRFDLPAPVLPASEFLQAVSGEGGVGNLPALP